MNNEDTNTGRTSETSSFSIAVGSMTKMKTLIVMFAVRAVWVVMSDLWVYNQELLIQYLCMFAMIAVSTVFASHPGLVVE